MQYRMRIAIFIMLSVLLGILFACDDEDKIIGCGTRSHIYWDHLNIGAEYDTVHLFMAAGMPEEFGKPVTFTLRGTDDYADSMIVFLYVYGISNTEDPEPYKEIAWRSDTLIIWYSGGWPNLDHLPLRSPQIPCTPPCPPPYYRIDHIDIRHANNVVIETHEEILH